MKKFLFISPIALLALGGCTISIIQTDTHGVATDVVDETATTEAKTDADLNIPVKPL